LNRSPSSVEDKSETVVVDGVAFVANSWHGQPKLIVENDHETGSIAAPAALVAPEAVTL
jgi:hypothetical protein